MKATDVHRYQESWERYWSSLPPDPQTAFWDCRPDHAAAIDLAHCKEAFGQERPVVDFGCGNGTQTRFLSKHFPRVIGVDVSEAAINMARASAASLTAEYETLDGTDTEAVKAFAERVGDANVYMRTVLHQMLPEHRAPLVAAIETLAGRTGVIYMVELSAEAEAFFNDVTAKRGGPPPGLARVLENGITPGLLSVEDVERLFPTHHVETGPTVVRTVEVLPDGAPVEVPAFYALIRRQ